MRQAAHYLAGLPVHHQYVLVQLADSKILPVVTESEADGPKTFVRFGVALINVALINLVGSSVQLEEPDPARGSDSEFAIGCKADLVDGSGDLRQRYPGFPRAGIPHYDLASMLTNGICLEQ